MLGRNPCNKLHHWCTVAVWSAAKVDGPERVQGVADGSPEGAAVCVVERPPCAAVLVRVERQHLRRATTVKGHDAVALDMRRAYEFIIVHQFCVDAANLDSSRRRKPPAGSVSRGPNSVHAVHITELTAFCVSPRSSQRSHRVA